MKRYGSLLLLKNSNESFIMSNSWPPFIMDGVLTLWERINKLDLFSAHNIMNEAPISDIQHNMNTVLALYFFKSIC